MTTGFSESASAAAARFAVLRKPFRQRELREALLRAIDVEPDSGAKN